MFNATFRITVLVSFLLLAAMLTAWAFSQGEGFSVGTLEGGAYGSGNHFVLIGEHSTSAGADSLIRWAALGIEYVAVGRLNDCTDFLTIPYWLVSLVSSVLPVIWLFNVVRQKHDRIEGLCAECGYDLRATPQRCPECGTANSQAADADALVA